MRLSYFLTPSPPSSSTLFPYTTLFRSDDVPASVRNTFEKLGIPEAERKFLAGVGAQYESERSEEHTSELQSHSDLVCRLLLEKKKTGDTEYSTTVTRKSQYIARMFVSR